METRVAHGEPYPTPAARRRVSPVDGLIVALTLAAVVALGTISPELLNYLKVPYISAGGNFLAKLHPATYLTIAALLLLLLRRGDPIGEIDRILADAKLLPVFLFACALLVFQCLALHRPFSGVIDTFLLPAMLAIVLWTLSPRQRKPLAVGLHVVIWLNIAIAFYEYFAKVRLVPMTLGDLVVKGDWRSTALLDHPLSAASIIAMYIMTLLLRKQPRSPWRLPAVALALCSLLAFGGRTAFVAVLVVLAGLTVMNCARLIRGERFGLGSVILATCGVLAVAIAVPLVLGSGLFDNMIARFSSDNGSAHARIATLHLLSYLDWKEIMLGTVPSRAIALQTMLGLQYGIEDFWIACIVQYGLVQTLLITIGLACFFAEILRHSAPGARVAVLFACVVAASSVSFSSKNIMLAIYVSLILLLLPRTAPARRRSRQPALGGPTDYAPAFAAQ